MKAITLRLQNSQGKTWQRARSDARAVVLAFLGHVHAHTYVQILRASYTPHGAATVFEDVGSTAPPTFPAAAQGGCGSTASPAFLAPQDAASPTAKSAFPLHASSALNAGLANASA
eukprot:2007931-Amphidinium_carterae.1